MPARYLAPLATLTMIVHLAGAATVYVNNETGHDTHTGTQATNAFQTLARAVQALQAGDTLVIANTGVAYAESLRLGGRSGTPDRPIVIEGNGAVLSGLRPLATGRWTAQDDGTFLFPHGCRGARRPYLVENGARLPEAASRAAIEPGQWHWATNGVYFRPAPDRTLADHKLSGTLGDSGFAVSRGSYITCRNLVCEYFSNDGFNIHGDCRGMVFENITGRHNGDDGFSIHEDVYASVRGGYFHHNNYGIQDVNASWSLFNGILAESNRIHGIHFAGGMHRVTDSVVRNNAQDQVLVTPGSAGHLGFRRDHPGGVGHTYLKNVVATGGGTALHVGKGATAAAANCIFTGAATGVRAAGTTAHVTSSVVFDCGEREVLREAGTLVLDYNLYWPGRIQWDDRLYTPGDWQAYRDATGMDANSAVAEPAFLPDGSRRLAAAEWEREKPNVRIGLTAPAWR